MADVFQKSSFQGQLTCSQSGYYPGLLSCLAAWEQVRPGPHYAADGGGGRGGWRIPGTREGQSRDSEKDWQEEPPALPSRPLIQDSVMPECKGPGFQQPLGKGFKTEETEMGQSQS